MKKLLSILTLAVLGSGCTLSPEERQAIFDKYQGVEAKAVTAAFSEFEARYRGPADGNGLESRLILRGATSELLGILDRSMDPDKRPARIEGYLFARSKNQRYYRIRYELKLDGWFSSDCLQKAQCDLKRYSAEMMDESRAMAFFYQSSRFTHARFKEIFKQDAPPTNVEM